MEGGTDAIRLQQVADDVGVSHPAILHHFGSRESLLEEVVKRAFETLETDVIQAFSEIERAGAPTALQMIERARRVLVQRGHGRAMAWLLLSGKVRGVRDTRVRTIAEVAHRKRLDTRGPVACGPFEDTLFRTLLIGMMLVGESVAGASLRESAGLGGDPAAQKRFTEWFARLITTNVDEG